MLNLPEEQKNLLLFLALAGFMGYAFLFGFTTTTIFPLLTGVILSIAFYFIAKNMQDKK